MPENEYALYILHSYSQWFTCNTQYYTGGKSAVVTHDLNPDGIYKALEIEGVVDKRLLARKITAYTLEILNPSSSTASTDTIKESQALSDKMKNR